MYAPAQPAQPTIALPPVEIAAAATPSFGASGPGPRLRMALHVRRASLNVLADQTTSVAGTLSPGLAGRKVTLQALGDHGWHTIARARSRSGGRFRIRYVPRETGSERVRLGFAGDAT